jgi:hypothetical protein
MPVYREERDAIEGEVISCQARAIGKIRVVRGTSTHRIQRVIIRRNAYCIIDKPIRLRRSS